MVVIPIVDSVAQVLAVQLGSQTCTLNLYQKNTGFFCDLYVNDTLIVGGVICRNLNRIVRSLYLGFSGDLLFNDTQGDDDPFSPGLGTRFVLFYLDPTDLGGLG